MSRIPLRWLEGREAECTCGRRRPSTDAHSGLLAFFEYLGPGSADLRKRCKHCGWHPVTHPDFVSVVDHEMSWHEELKARKNLRDHPFEPSEPSVTDRYYCGCRGWD